MFQLIARHLLHTLNIIVVESFTTPHHYCPMSVQPLPAFTVTLHDFWFHIHARTAPMGGVFFAGADYGHYRAVKRTQRYLLRLSFKTAALP